MTAILLGPDQSVPSGLARLWADDVPNRCLLATALDAGGSHVDVVVDDVTDPSVAVVRTRFGAWTFASDPTSPFVTAAVDVLRRTGGLWLTWPEGSPEPPPEAAGSVDRLAFTDRDRSVLPPDLPAGTTLEPITSVLRERLEWGAEFDDPPTNAVPGFGAGAFGLALTGDGEILCETYAPWWSPDLVEIGVITPEAHRGKGLATVTCAHLAARIEDLGLPTTWTCDRANVASAATARAIGYRTEQPYAFHVYPPS